MDEKGRRNTERDQVRQGVKLTSKRALGPAHARNAPVQEIENASQENEEERVPNDRRKVSRRNVGFNNLRQRHKATEQIARRHQVRQEVNLQLARINHLVLSLWRPVWHTLCKGRQHRLATCDFLAKLHLNLDGHGQVKIDAGSELDQTSPLTFSDSFALSNPGNDAPGQQSGD